MASVQTEQTPAEEMVTYEELEHLEYEFDDVDCEIS